MVEIKFHHKTILILQLLWNSLRKYFFLIFLASLFIHEIKLSFNSKISNKYNKKKILFTFWEPKGKIPGYLQLCMKTWKIFLPDYEIKIMDYQQVKEYLGETLFSNIICKSMPLSMQADAMRVALLSKYGGIWMDADTIVLNGDFIKEFENFELAMIGEGKDNFQYMGFIFASNNSSILNSWLKIIIDRVKYYKNILVDKRNFSISNETLKMVNSFDYLGNGIIDSILKNNNNTKYLRVESSRLNTFPERKIFTNSSIDKKQKYKLFYFQKGEPQTIIKNLTYLILLHNSWTPHKYKTMSENEFLNQDILLSKLLGQILGNNQ